MNLTKKQKIIISAAAVVVLLVVYVSFDRKSKVGNGSETANETQSTSTNQVLPNTNIVTTGTGGYKIEQVTADDFKSSIPVPDLDRPVSTQAGVVVAPEAKSFASGKILELQTRLKKNTSDLMAWLDLGIYQKQAGDYQGAILSWTYASKLAPTDYISLGNLGDLYAYFLKDNAQSEISYKQAIVRGPTQSYLYAQLAEIYRDIFKDTSKAKAILDQGLSKIPNDARLLQIKASLN